MNHFKASLAFGIVATSLLMGCTPEQVTHHQPAQEPPADSLQNTQHRADLAKTFLLQNNYIVQKQSLHSFCVANSSDHCVDGFIVSKVKDDGHLYEVRVTTNLSAETMQFTEVEPKDLGQKVSTLAPKP